MKHFYHFLTFAIVFVATASFAQTFTLTENQTGQRFYCGAGQGPVNPPSDPNCVDKVSTDCSKNTTYSGNQCFTEAQTACKGAGFNFGDCVVHTSATCRQNTTYSSNMCFQNALDGCKGSDAAIASLVHGAREKAITDTAKSMQKN